MCITFSPFGAIVAKGSEERTLHCSVTRKGDCNLSHSLIILYQIEHIMSSFFLHHTYLYQPKVMQNIAIQIRWSGKESNLTQPIGHQCYYASLDLSNDIETHGASTISTPCLPCGSSRFASPLSTQHNYYIKTPTICQVFFNLFLFFFWSAHPPLPVQFPEGTYSLRPTYFI